MAIRPTKKSRKYGGDPEPSKEFLSTRKQVPPPDGYVSQPIDKQEFLETVAKLPA